MKSKILYVCLYVCSSLLFSSQDFNARLSKLEEDMDSVFSSNPSGTFGAKLASTRPKIDGFGYFITFDVLYWQVKADGTEFAYSSVNRIQSYPVRGQIYPVSFKWDWGFRIGLGKNFVHGNWDISADYTYFKSTGRAKVFSGTGGQVVPLKGDPQITTNPSGESIDTVDQASGNYGMDFDRIDLALAKGFFINYNLSFKPHVGLATAWINQKQTTRYTGGQLGINTIQVKDRCDFWGIGPRTGFNSKWYLTNGFSIFGNASGALVYGLFQVQHKNWFSALENNKVFLEGNVHKFSPTADVQIGLVYDGYIYDEKQYLSVSLGYECQYWWSMNQCFTFDNSVGYQTYSRQTSNLSFHGVDLHISWNF